MRSWKWVRWLGGIAILAVLVWQLGTGPFLDAVRLIDRSAVLVALGIGAVTTLCCAWRWRLIAAGLGVRLPLGRAVAAYYRSQFLNSTLPGGVAGDVHRGVRHGIDLGDVGLGLRAVVLERASGLVAQIAIAVVVLSALPSPVRAEVPMIAAAVAVAALAVLLVLRLVAWGGPARWARGLRAAWSDVRGGLLARRMWPGIVLTSFVVLAGHLATFLLAARVAGATAPLVQLVPLTLLALLAMALPLHVAGWGPREGVAAWAFGMAGLTASQGVAAAVTYGVLALIATLPGAAVALVPRLGGGAR